MAKRKENCQIISRSPSVRTFTVCGWKRRHRRRSQSQDSSYPFTAGTGADFCPAPSVFVRSTEKRSRLRLVYRIAGKGTEEFSKAKGVIRFRSLDLWEMDFPWKRQKEKERF